ncbi:MAG: PAS domain S-box protein [Deltaproteobacteria bacterium]|nr:PAS domain S-box protein [Deltaproteobacteria bacterium]
MEPKVRKNKIQIYKQLEELKQQLEEKTRQLEKAKAAGRKAGFLYGLIRYSPDAIITADDENKILTWNNAAKIITGFNAFDIKGRSLNDLFFLPEEGPQFIQELEENGEIRNREVLLQSRDGSEIYASVSASLLEESEEDGAQKLLIIRDISELREMRNRLIESEKLAAMAKVAGAVVHEIRNPLNALYLNLDLLEDEMEINGQTQNPNIAKLMKIVREEIERLGELAKGYLSLSGIFKRQPQITQLNEIIDRLSEEVSIECLKRHINLRIDLDPDLPLVIWDRNQFHRVILNLLNNSFEAMPGGGDISVSTTCNGEGILIKIEDSGIGIPEKYQDKLFTPFFSLKNSGTGLGLFLVKEMVRAHGGTIAIESETQLGTSIVIELPFESENPDNS